MNAHIQMFWGSGGGPSWSHLPAGAALAAQGKQVSVQHLWFGAIPKEQGALGTALLCSSHRGKGQ